jgi:hypothetical protein
MVLRAITRTPNPIRLNTTDTIVGVDVCETSTALTARSATVVTPDRTVNPHPHLSATRRRPFHSRRGGHSGEMEEAERVTMCGYHDDLLTVVLYHGCLMAPSSVDAPPPAMSLRPRIAMLLPSVKSRFMLSSRILHRVRSRADGMKRGGKHKESGVDASGHPDHSW